MDTTILALAGTLVTAVGGYLVAARRFSGKIGSSEAADLWKESASIREWSKARIESLERENGHLYTVIDKMRSEREKDLQRIASLETRLNIYEGGEDVPGHLS